MFSECSHIEVSKSTKWNQIYVNYTLNLGCESLVQNRDF